MFPEQAGDAASSSYEYDNIVTAGDTNGFLDVYALLAPGFDFAAHGYDFDFDYYSL
jgi:hypothetical protein